MTLLKAEKSNFSLICKELKVWHMFYFLIYLVHIDDPSICKAWERTFTVTYY